MESISSGTLTETVVHFFLHVVLCRFFFCPGCTLMHIDLSGCSRDVLALFVVLKWSLNNYSSSCINMLITSFTPVFSVVFSYSFLPFSCALMSPFDGE